MKDLNIVGRNFLTAIGLAPESKNNANQDNILAVLDAIRLRDNFHLSLRLAAEGGLGDESAYYCYEGKKNEFVQDEFLIRGSTMASSHRLFRGLAVEKSVRGAWQAYLLFVSETMLPVFWHGGYIRRTYFFDRENYQGINPRYGEDIVNIPLMKIPEPSVELKGDISVIECPFWNDWMGLVREKIRIKFSDNNLVSFGKPMWRVLYKYDCGILF